jgi:Protein of unknown function (DUF3106)
MQFKESSLNFVIRRSVVNRLLLPCLLLGIAAVPYQAIAQSQPVSTQPSQGVPPPPAVTQSSPPWSSLGKAQQTALAPLEHSWAGLSEGQKRKWIAIAASYSNLQQPEQEKLHSRMAEWAALSPADREVARLNFAQSKAIAKPGRAADWEAYQALSPDERKKLAEGAKSKPVGAAVAIKPIAPEKLATVPVTRRTPAAERKAAVSQMPLNRNTLLPQRPPPAGAAAVTSPKSQTKP